MKLYMCNATAIDYDPFGLVVANNEEEAKIKFANQLDDQDIWYTGMVFAREIDEINGYKIICCKKDVKDEQ